MDVQTVILDNYACSLYTRTSYILAVLAPLVANTVTRSLPAFILSNWCSRRRI